MQTPASGRSGDGGFRGVGGEGGGGGGETFKLSVKEPWGKVRPSVLTNEPRATKRGSLALTPPLVTSRRRFHDGLKNTSVFLGSGPVFHPAEEAESCSASCQRCRRARERPRPFSSTQPGAPWPPPGVPGLRGRPEHNRCPAEVRPPLLTRLPEQTTPGPPGGVP